jgi:hypothetical protein
MHCSMTGHHWSASRHCAHKVLSVRKSSPSKKQISIDLTFPSSSTFSLTRTVRPGHEGEFRDLNVNWDRVTFVFNFQVHVFEGSFAEETAYSIRMQYST